MKQKRKTEVKTLNGETRIELTLSTSNPASLIAMALNINDPDVISQTPHS